MISRSYERIIPKVTANISLNDFPTDTIPKNKVFILTLRACSHGESRNGVKTGLPVIRV